ncbi:GMC family oxidoreductase [Pseudomonas typographi]|uniref:GMC family oxidoreductase n=1 Tax=Pseudomonas typographi TaxID=2715964 RepID=A0ABR7YX57_9PSED|nr:GMC family oxidoreductase [Pseudomonas typographi]MBD1551191.1 GMC family oxidoreductase [Pseudomonas typographi]MBD1586315.1 GMC family oxidoreductase [Pseudomonas typographi]MBD1597787.1 GMC family oxidoreductase [Pseudomonas typographi]
MPDAEVVVIGSGICGALAARRLALAGADVLVLEAGGPIERGQVVAAFRDSPRKSDWLAPYPYHPWAPHPLYLPEENNYLVQAGPDPWPVQYLRGVGGTSWHWAAQAWRLLPSDLRLASLYGVGVDWPLSYEELDPWYQEAEELMGVAGAEDTGSPRSQPFPMAPVAEPWAMRRIRERLAPLYAVTANTAARNSRSYGGRPACCGNNSCQPICPIDAQYHGGLAIRSALDAGARLQSHAVVHRLEADAGGRIRAAHYLTPDGQPRQVSGQVFIVAANGVESPKLLLMSGLANRSGQVGRNLMDHLSTALTFEADEPLWLGRGPQSPSAINSRRDGEFRREHAAYRLDFTNISRVDSVTNDLLEKGVYGPAFEQQLRRRVAHEMGVRNVLEVLPDPANRIVLSGRTDALGLPTPQVHYRIDDYVRRGAQAAQQDFALIAERMGGQRLRYSAAGKFSANHHITGTLAMGDDPARSVCDRYGRAHDHDNLYLCGTAVMPTSGTMNATLTAVALALRSAEQIRPMPAARA